MDELGEHPGDYINDDDIQQLIEAYDKGEISEDDFRQFLDYTTQEQPMALSLTTLAVDCGVPTLTQISDTLVPLLLLCVAYRVLVAYLQQNDNGARFNHGDSPSITNIVHDANITDNLIEFSNCVLGMVFSINARSRFVAMELIFGAEMLMLIVYAMSAFVVLVIARDHGRHIGLWVSLFSVIYVLLCNIRPSLLLTSPSYRDSSSVPSKTSEGAQMVMSMKVIALAFDLEGGYIARAPSIWAFSSFVFHVGTLIFGPWMSYREYQRRLLSPLNVIDFGLARRIVEKTVLLLVCLLMSTCFIPWLISDTNFKWFVAYRDAQSFRFSHYFVSYTSQLTLLITSYSVLNSDMPVARPTMIEIPRSLVDVVTNWNIPMHTWLKTYVFKNARQFGAFPAILVTYAASSLLHGLNFQLSAVLLTLGFYTYVEYVFRNKLAYIFSACIQARACKSDCTHRYKHNHPSVIVANVALAALSMFHLTYLGLMFDGSNQSDQGYTMSHTLSKWSNLGYLSHIVAAVTYVFYVLV